MTMFGHCAYRRLINLLWISLLSASPCLAEISGRIGYRSGLDLSDGSGYGLRFGHTVTCISYLSNSSGVRWSLDAEYSRPDERFVYEGGGWSIRVPSRTASMLVRAKAAFLREQVWLGYEWEGDHDRGISHRLKLTVQPMRQIALIFERERRQFIPWSSDARYFSGGQSEGGLIRWNALADMATFRFRTHPIDAISISSFATEVRSPGQAEEREGQIGGDYDFVIGGVARDGEMAAQVNFTRTLTLSCRYHRLSIRTQLMGYAERDQFAHFGIVNADAEWWGGDVQGGYGTIGFSVGQATANIGGVIEAGPFLHDLRVLLGVRRQIIGWGRIHWVEGGYRGQMLRSGRFASDWQLVVVKISPEVVLKSWTSTFGFNVSDLRRDELDIIRATLARIGVAPEYNWGAVKFRAALSQWIPLSVSRRAKLSGTNGSSGVSGGSSSNSHPLTGFSFSCSLSVRL